MPRLRPTVIIPGHGDAETNTDFLRSNIALFQEVMQQVKADKAKGLTAEQTAEALDKQNAELAAKIGIKDAETAAAFKDYFLDVFVKRAYRELDGRWEICRMGYIPSVKRGNPIA